MLKFEAIEDNGGGLHLVVFDKNDKVIYLHSGYEYNQGNLLSDIDEIESGISPIDTDSFWDGNDENPQASYNNITSFKYGWNVVADNNGVYPKKMGAAAQLEFRIETE